MQNVDNISYTGRYSTNETAALLDINRRTLTRWVNAGKITPKYRKADMKPYYTGKEILRLLQPL